LTDLYLSLLTIYLPIFHYSVSEIYISFKKIIIKNKRRNGKKKLKMKRDEIKKFTKLLEKKKKRKVERED